MDSSNLTSLSVALLITLSAISGATAAVFTVRNNCPYTVWAAATPVGGGRRLNRGESWTFNVPAGTRGGRVWGRTGCSFDGAGRGRCQTGDCAGALECRLSGQKPLTLAEYTLGSGGARDFYDISVIDGFNLRMEFSGGSDGCNQRTLRCAADIIGQCPSELRIPNGCNDPCTVFRTNEYCCNTGPCGPTRFSRFFKDRCPDAYSYPKDNTATKSCPGGTNYNVVFCP
ncbi:protein P21-like [Andrographis paniculata]|uniref:protein P21-like n=1 Tax=Andrographis paniculata TaxID=175694 RepID=UPI0021E74A0A|nr:protein P21-like [Andrographis paniculata]